MQSTAFAIIVKSVKIGIKLQDLITSRTFNLDV
jgi:hypothetical protein